MQMRWGLWLTWAIVLMGVALIGYACSMPVYTEPDVHRRIDKELEDASFETRSKLWFQRLREFETPHKRLFDLGQGLVAAGFGAFFIRRRVATYRRFAEARTRRRIFRLWWGAWLLRVPTGIYYYTHRQWRGDYPWWADSIAIPIFGEIMNAGIFGGISLLVLKSLLGDRCLPDALEKLWPPQPGRKIHGWLLLLWGGLLATLICLAIPAGDIGTVLSCMIAMFVLAVVLASQREPVAFSTR